MADPGPLRPVDALFPERREAILADRCAGCGAGSLSFRDGLSRREYLISGLCQACQDNTFRPAATEDQP